MLDARRSAVALALVLPSAAACRAPDASDGATAGSAAPTEAEAIAGAVLERLGGRERWESARHVSWRFFGGRRHVWDKHEGRLRLELPDGMLVLLDLETGEGRAFEGGVEVAEPARSAAALEAAHAAWINDSYWTFMPYKLLDPGVRLEALGAGELPDGRSARVLELEFDEVGLTPENRYRVWVADDTGLVEQWAFYERASDDEPRFTLPWADWREIGGLWFATRHVPDPAEASDWQIGVQDELPESVYTDPAPIGL